MNKAFHTTNAAFGCLLVAMIVLLSLERKQTATLAKQLVASREAVLLSEKDFIRLDQDNVELWEESNRLRNSSVREMFDMSVAGRVKTYHLWSGQNVPPRGLRFR